MLPVRSESFSAMPPFVTIMPSCEIGFRSKYSIINCSAYERVRSSRDGRRSFSIIASERSMIKNICRIIPRRIVAVSRKSLKIADGLIIQNSYLI